MSWFVNAEAQSCLRFGILCNRLYVLLALHLTRFRVCLFSACSASDVSIIYVGLERDESHVGGDVSHACGWCSKILYTQICIDLYFSWDTFVWLLEVRVCVNPILVRYGFCTAVVFNSNQGFLGSNSAAVVGLYVG